MIDEIQSGGLKERKCYGILGVVGGCNYKTDLKWDCSVWIRLIWLRISSGASHAQDN
jgi:hypothetical protein